ncbi:MAG: hypothetical protein HC902_11430 [Calothrix sp. SM1_5_4]|nr:hypothetical protein [Calothrix sp. SM1_5_4]
MYCNPTEILLSRVERSRRVLTDPRVQAHCLEVGPMVLTGSTRMQASTVLMLVIGLAFAFRRDVDGAFRALDEWIGNLEKADTSPLEGFIVEEARAYQAGERTLFRADDYAITVFTDTTERAPTFNIAPFGPDSPAYIAIAGTQNADEAWNKLLGRAPRPLAWHDVHPKTSEEYLRGFDFSREVIHARRQAAPGREQHEFTIEHVGRAIHYRFRGMEARFVLPAQSELFDHLTLKMWLNMQSTLTFGRLGRFEGNLMTWVYPSNGKLVDRAARYTQILLQRRGIDGFSYDDIVRAQFECKKI